MVFKPRWTKSSKLSIGYASYQPTVYYARGNTIFTKSSKTGQCEKISTAFVPELYWFLRYTYTDQELQEATVGAGKGYHMGPTGVLLMLIKHDVSDQGSKNRRDFL